MMWISIVYVYKAVLLAVGLYFTWNTRQVCQLIIRLMLLQYTGWAKTGPLLKVCNLESRSIGYIILSSPLFD